MGNFWSSLHYIAKRLKPGDNIEPFCPIAPEVDSSRRQKRETAYYLTGGFYMRRRAVVESLADPKDSHTLGRDSRAVVVDEIEAIDINTEFDFMLAEFIVEKGLNRS